jgi:biopolymer transport protein ExbD
MACPAQERISAHKSDLPAREEIDPALYEKLNYVDLDKDANLFLNDNPVEQSDLCQALFTEHAFSWHIVLSAPSKRNEAAYQQVKEELKSCHYKYLQLQAIDLYDKTLEQLVPKTKGRVEEMFPLQVIEARR